MGDPDAIALLYVQQWLHEQGYEEALHALEQKSGLLYDDSKLESSSQLIQATSNKGLATQRIVKMDEAADLVDILVPTWMQLVWRHLDDQLAEAAPAEGSEQARIAAEDEAMLRGGKMDFPQTVTHSIRGVHSSSVVCVRLVPGRDEVITGAGGPSSSPSDGSLRRVGFDGQLHWCTLVGSGGVLCMELHPRAYGSQDGMDLASAVSQGVQGSGNTPGMDAAGPLHLACLLAVGSMDGSVSMVNADSGSLLATQKAHLKYVIRVCWAGDGRHLVSCSHDHSLGIHTVDLPAGDSEPSEATLTTTRKIQFLSSVQDATFLNDGHTLVVGLRDTCYLRVLDIDKPEAEERLVNLNASGDEHVSFFARHLVPSPCGRFLLVSTDTGRMLVLRTRTWELCRYTLLTVPTAQFHQFCAAWHRDSHYVFSGAAGAQVWVHHVGSGKVVAKLSVHTVNVRDLDYDPHRNLLATASFDKTVNVLAYQPGQADQH